MKPFIHQETAAGEVVTANYKPLDEANATYEEMQDLDRRIEEAGDNLRATLTLLAKTPSDASVSDDCSLGSAADLPDAPSAYERLPQASAPSVDSPPVRPRLAHGAVWAIPVPALRSRRRRRS